MDCRDHYNKFYMSGTMKELMCSPCSSPFVKEHTYPNKIPDSEVGNNLPCDLRLYHQKLLGYLPYRDEFEIEYLNSAEEVLNSVYTTSNCDELDKAFYLALMGIYNQYIQERHFRHRLARSHNLVTHLMRDLIRKQSKQKLSNYISRPGVIKRGCYTKRSSHGSVSRIKKVSRRLCYSDSCRKRETAYSPKLKNRVYRISDFNFNSNAMMSGRMDAEVFDQSLALTQKHLNCSYESIPTPQIQQYCISHQVLENNNNKDSSTANLIIPGMGQNLAVPNVTKTFLVRDDSWLTESCTSSEILDSGISSAESSSNSTTSCGNFSDQLNSNPLKSTIDLQLSSQRVPARPRSNSDSACNAGIVRLKTQYPSWNGQTLPSNRLTNSAFSEIASVQNVIECLFQSAEEVKTRVFAPQGRRRGRLARKFKTMSCLSHNQNTEQQNEQSFLKCSISNSENVNTESCGEIQYHTSGNEILQTDISSNSDIYNSLKILIWLAENVETPLTVPVHRRRGRPPRNPRIPSSTSQSVYNAKSCEKTFLTHPQWLRPFFRYLSTSEAETFLKNLERERILRIELSQLIQDYCGFSMKTVADCVVREDSSSRFDLYKNLSSLCSSTSTSPLLPPSTSPVSKKSTASFVHHRLSNFMKLRKLKRSFSTTSRKPVHNFASNKMNQYRSFAHYNNYNLRRLNFANRINQKISCKRTQTVFN
ncbi:unnamed protein product [Schistosoma rodhaini]|uniref:Transcriptional adapter 2-alpha/beta-like domain-containing protein n=1 Tax=Schistosoma rodhaini TaxID=6188 RepID=A0AA85FLK4_9TREM|nr:unnamed protein product [Schistosoma rodhaini]